ncbi:conserved hypothetical protein [Histoplasma capsulatum var. duboisii H88]|uniref:Protein kinase domain-containing protein n=1 Tax=Ajellomyces capsulatus (strain H88) TaxID=544711 RepID=F0UT85_AJEC8|nr:conserved hypothetical protein [Histoplasma capsulatum var. duboisii H88]
MISDGEGMTVHLQPDNILFSAAGVLQNELLLPPPEFSSVRCLEGMSRDNSTPEYLIRLQRFRGFLDDADFCTLLVRIGDLGGVVWNQQFDKRPVAPRALWAPELKDRNAWDASIDIWTLGCLINEHFTEYLKDRLPSDFGAENISYLVSFLSLILQIYPNKRPSAIKYLNTSS